jgi:hypothetical protein
VKKTVTFLILLGLLGIGCDVWRSRTGVNVVHADEQTKWAKVEVSLKVYHREHRGSPSSGYASAEGFWQSTSSSKDKQLVFPIAVSIWCSHSKETCTESDATVAFGVLKPTLIEYQISSWTDDGVVADDTDEGECAIGHRLSLDFQGNGVTITDYPKKVSGKECEAFQDANSYTLRGGNLVLDPPPLWDPLAKPAGKN